MLTLSNATAHEAMKKVIAGGGSSNMRNAGVQTPLVLSSSSGCRIRDIEGNDLIDVKGGYGPFIFGYGDSEVLDAIAASLQTRGSLVGLPFDIDSDAAQLIVDLVPSIEQVRFANSGSEAVASAVRLARMVTNRPLIVTFEGHYHGWNDAVFHRLHPSKEQLRAIDGGAVLAGARGMVSGPLEQTLRVNWNDVEALKRVFEEHGPAIAGVIAEPVAGNCGVIPPLPGYLEAVRDITRDAGSLLIFDEVITGFRVAAGGAQELYAVAPDITILSKALGGGFPVSAFGGSAEIMGPLARNEAFHGGVFAGNPTALAAVAATLTKIADRGPALYDALDATGEFAESRLRETFAQLGRHVLIQRVGSLISVALATRPVQAVENYRVALDVVDFEGHGLLQQACQARGVYFHPSPFEPWFLGTAHERADLEVVCGTIADALSGEPV